MPACLVSLMLFCCLLLGSSCRHNQDIKQGDLEAEVASHAVETSDSLVFLRFDPPAGYVRQPVDTASFAFYLRHLPLKPRNAAVSYYDGGTKLAGAVYAAVIDLEIGTQDLHQCADAVIRLRAEYLWQQGRYDDIHFNFTNGHSVHYSEWMKGKRIAIEGNRTWWQQRTSASNTYADLWDYLQVIFMYAGTASLEKELKPVNIADVQAGDVLIQGGHPGHAVIIVDEAVDESSGDRIFLLAQSYMPAQELQVLQNPNSAPISPWY